MLGYTHPDFETPWGGLFLHTLICAGLCALPLHTLMLFDSGFNILPDVFEMLAYVRNEWSGWSNVESWNGDSIDAGGVRERRGKIMDGHLQRKGDAYRVPRWVRLFFVPIAMVIALSIMLVAFIEQTAVMVITIGVGLVLGLFVNVEGSSTSEMNGSGSQMGSFEEKSAAAGGVGDKKGSPINHKHNQGEIVLNVREVALTDKARSISDVSSVSSTSTVSLASSQLLRRQQADMPLLEPTSLTESAGSGGAGIEMKIV